MPQWFKKNLGDAMLAIEQQDSIKEILMNEFGQVIESGNLVAYVRHESEGRLHCELIIYLSSESELIAQTIGAQPCIKPNVEGLSLLVGFEKSCSK